MRADCAGQAARLIQTTPSGSRRRQEGEHTVKCVCDRRFVCASGSLPGPFRCWPAGGGGGSGSETPPAERKSAAHRQSSAIERPDRTFQ